MLHDAVAAPPPSIAGLIRGRIRMLIDNDFSGDPDDLFQLVHHLLSPAVDVVGVIGSHLSLGDGFDSSDRQAANAVRVVHNMLRILGMPDATPVYRGSEVALSDEQTPLDSPAVRAILAECAKDDPRPLFYCAGGGLTDIASALLLDPSVAERLTLVWLGGAEYPDLAEPLAGAPAVDYNHAIDEVAARVVFNFSTVPFWQIPRSTYRQALMSYAEIDVRVAPAGPVGAMLAHAIGSVIALAHRHGKELGDCYNMADSSLVLVTVLNSAFEPDASSSAWVWYPRPTLDQDSRYGPARPGAGTIRVFTELDTRLLFEDFFAKLTQHAARSAPRG